MSNANSLGTLSDVRELTQRERAQRAHDAFLRNNAKRLLTPVSIFRLPVQSEVKAQMKATRAARRAAHAAMMAARKTAT